MEAASRVPQGEELAIYVQVGDSEVLERVQTMVADDRAIHTWCR